VAQLVEAPRYKPEGRMFDLRLSPSYRTMDLGSTQPVIEMSTRGISCWVKAVLRKGGNFTTFLY
jgi:hypothetical protein